MEDGGWRTEDGGWRTGTPLMARFLTTDLDWLVLVDDDTMLSVSG